MSNELDSPRNPFLIPDLFHCLLECLLTSSPQRPGPSEEQRTLAALARTCRAFSEPSLNCLWRSLNSLLPLIRCFADSDVVDERRVKTRPSPPEWLVIDRYSPRIREITLGNESLSLYFLLLTALVLPNLRVFRWKCPPTISKFPFDSLAFPWQLLGPQIVAIEVELNTVNDPNYRLFLGYYCSLFCPNLKSIKCNFLHGIRNHRTVSQVLTKAICINADWRHVELSVPIDHVVLKHLGMSSILRTVALRLAPQTSRPGETCFGPRDTPFCNVTDLALMLGNSLDLVTSLLRPRDQAFHSFKVTLYTLTLASEVSALLTALASPQRIRSLQSLIVNHIPYIIHRSTRDIQGMPVHQHLTCETFRPLVSLVHLRELVIHLDNSTSLDDEDFAGLVRNWPLLEILKMMWVHREHPVASITLKGLLSLLASCRKLRQIGLTLDARDVPVGAYVHSDVCRPLITSPITVCNSPLKHPDLVAKFLSKHLPSMPGVLPTMIWISPTPGSGRYCFPYRRLWSQVNEHIKHPMFSRVALEDAPFPMLKRLWHCLRRSDDGQCTSFVDVFPPEEDFVW